MRFDRSLAVLVMAAVTAAAAPLAATYGHAPAADTVAFPGWPASYEGRALSPLALSGREEAFARDFPGRIGRFSDGRREIVLRYVAQATRRLHPASDCYRGLGYAIEPGPLQRDAKGDALGCFHARKGDDVTAVCEGIRDPTGRAWSDVSEWYWDALLGRSAGPWWSVVMAETVVKRMPDE